MLLGLSTYCRLFTRGFPFMNRERSITEFHKKVHRSLLGTGEFLIKGLTVFLL